ncbi:MAG: hypothetical protein HXS46_07780 [Theionarchaea archaeon]|nr:hypothetical protein [Theionarchaea archaeon]
MNSPQPTGDAPEKVILLNPVKERSHSPGMLQLYLYLQNKAKNLWERSLILYKELQETLEIKKVEHNLREINKKQKEEYLEKTYWRALQMGTSQDIKKAYKELSKFKIDGLIAATESNS